MLYVSHISHLHPQTSCRLIKTYSATHAAAARSPQLFLSKNRELLFMFCVLTSTCFSQIRCSRDVPGCQRCKAQGIACSYSRSGVIRRRNRKQRGRMNDSPSTRTPSETPAATERSGISHPPQLAPENVDSTITTHERLQRLVGRDHHSLKALASLLEEYAAAWKGLFAIR